MKRLRVLSVVVLMLLAIPPFLAAFICWDLAYLNPGVWEVSFRVFWAFMVAFISIPFLVVKLADSL